MVGLFAWPIVEEGEEGEGRVLPGHALPHALTALGFDQQQQVSAPLLLYGHSQSKAHRLRPEAVMLCVCVVVWQWELVGHEVWLTGGSKPKDRQTHDNRALARYYDLEAVRPHISHTPEAYTRVHSPVEGKTGRSS